MGVGPSIPTCASFIQVLQDYILPQSFFPGLFFSVYIKSPKPKIQKAQHHLSQTPSTEILIPKNPIPEPNPKTTINEQKCEKSIKNNPGKIIAILPARQR